MAFIKVRLFDGQEIYFNSDHVIKMTGNDTDNYRIYLTGETIIRDVPMTEFNRIKVELKIETGTIHDDGGLRSV